jgi:formiminotetrahydrofolate cyclodeaminase
MGAALVSMVCNLTIGRPKYVAVEARLGQILARAEALRAELTRLATKDAQAVDQLMVAYRLSKATDEEKAARQAAIEAATKQVVQTPLATARTCIELMALAQETAQMGNPNAAGDAHAGMFCAEAGLKIALMNVLIDLKLINDQAFVAQIEAELAPIKASHPSLYQEIDALINAR